MITDVPSAVPAPLASTHLLPYTINCLLDVYVNRWLVPPLQSHSCNWVPLLVLEFGTSRHRPEPTPRTWPAEPPGVLPAVVGTVEPPPRADSTALYAAFLLPLESNSSGLSPLRQES